jgi:hypothetical protein|tara:strand:+ start:272 stop:460 length:189 start_codon:yes stop_codon:yes gene_type:complete
MALKKAELASRIKKLEKMAHDPQNFMDKYQQVLEKLKVIDERLENIEDISSKRYQVVKDKEK